MLSWLGKRTSDPESDLRDLLEGESIKVVAFLSIAGERRQQGSLILDVNASKLRWERYLRRQTRFFEPPFEVEQVREPRRSSDARLREMIVHSAGRQIAMEIPAIDIPLVRRALDKINQRSG